MKTEYNQPNSAVIVTGGASGIGLASARALAAVGRPVAIWDLSAEKSQQVATDIASEFGVATFGLGIDLRDATVLAAAVQQTRAALPVLGGLVHAAGVVMQTKIDGLTADNWDSVMNVNLRALPLLVREMLPDLSANAGSAVVGIASINATLGNGLIPAYSASKGGMLSLVRSMADELGTMGVRINSLSPGQILTPMVKPTVEVLPEGTFERRILLGRLGDPEEIGKVVRFLLSNEASYITAAEIVVDGGNISSQR